MKKIYPYKMRDGSCAFMTKVLKYPAIVVDSRMDNAICRITNTGCTIKLNIKDQYQKELIANNDHLYEIEVIDIDDKTFPVLHSLLEPLGENSLFVDETGEK